MWPNLLRRCQPVSETLEDKLFRAFAAIANAGGRQASPRQLARIVGVIQEGGVVGGWKPAASAGEMIIVFSDAYGVHGEF